MELLSPPGESGSEQMQTLPWRSGAFAGHFCDSYVKDTSMEGGHVAKEMPMFMSNLLNAIKSAQDNDLATCIPDTAAVMRPVVETLQHVALVDNFLNQVCNGDLGTFLPHFVKKLEELPVRGPGMAFSGGWADLDGGHAILIIVFKDTAETYSVATCNTGEGSDYHPSIPTETGKAKTRTAICCSGVLRDRILDLQFWAVFFNVRNNPSDINRPEAWYDVMLPHLCGRNLFASSSDSIISIQKQLESEPEDTQGHFETVQRSGTCFYRCILSGCRYLMKRCGFKKPQQKLLFVHMRLCMLKTARQRWLQLHPSSSSTNSASVSAGSEPVQKSDVFILTIACNQTARAAGKLMAEGRTEPLSGAGHKSIAIFCEEFRSLLQKAEVDSSHVRPDTQGLVGGCSALDSSMQTPYAFPNLTHFSNNEMPESHEIASLPPQSAEDLHVDFCDAPCSQLHTYEEYVQLLCWCRGKCDSILQKAERASVSTQLLQVQTFLFDFFLKQLPVPFPSRFKLQSGAVLHEGCAVLHNEGSNVRKGVVVAIQNPKATLHDVERNTFFVTDLASLTPDVSVGPQVPLWANDRMASAELQTKAMEALYQLMLQLTSTSMSISSSSASDALVSLAAASIFVHADAVMHLQAEGSITSNLLLSERQKLRAFVGALHGKTLTFDIGMQFLHSAPFAQTRASILAYIKQNCYAPSIHGDDGIPALFHFVEQDPRPQPSDEAHKMLQLGRRSARYQPTFDFVTRLLAKTGKTGTLPTQSKTSHYRRAAAMEVKSSPFNNVMTWAFHETLGGIGCEDFAFYRDINFLMRLLQVPITLFRETQSVFDKVLSFRRIRPLKKLWTVADATPDYLELYNQNDFFVFSIQIGGQPIHYKFFSDVEPNETHPISSLTGILKHITALSSRQKPSKSASIAREDTVLCSDASFFASAADNPLNLEESEAFLTLLSTPAISVPLLLHFFEGDRIMRLQSHWLSCIFEDMLFRPGPLLRLNTDSPPDFSQVPGSTTGTANGYMMWEIEHFPEVLFSALHDLVRSAERRIDLNCKQLCGAFIEPQIYLLNNFTSDISPNHTTETAHADLQDADLRRRMSHIRVAMVLVRIICRVFHMVVACERVSPSFLSNPEVFSNASLLLSWMDGVSRSLQEGAYTTNASESTSLQSDQVFKENAGQSIIADSTPIRILLHSHIAMIQSVFLKLRDPSLSSKFSTFSLACRVPLSASLEAYSLSACFLTYWQSMSHSDSHVHTLSRVPIHEVFMLIHDMRHIVMQIASSIKQASTDGFNQILDHIATQVLRGRLYLHQNWQMPGKSVPIKRFVIETEHPYLPSYKWSQFARFPGAPRLRISFDSKTSTEFARDKWRIRDANNPNIVYEKSGDKTNGWPGTAQIPELVMHTDSIIVEFESDQSGSEWGVRMFVEAEVGPSCLLDLKSKYVEMMAEEYQFGDEIFKRALGQSYNSVDDAFQYIFDNMEALIDEDKALRSIAVPPFSGLFTLGQGRGLIIDLQSMSIFDGAGAASPLPKGIRLHPHFIELFGNRDILCSTIQSENFKQCTLDVDGREVIITSFKPRILASTKRGQIGDASSASNADYVNAPKAVDKNDSVMFMGQVFTPYQANPESWFHSLFVGVLDIAKGANITATFSNPVVTPDFQLLFCANIATAALSETWEGLPDAWFEVHGDYDSRSISVYALVENCRVLRRKLVYCSDNRTSMRTLAPCLSECLDLRPNDLKREAGNPLDGLVSSEGNICDHVGFGSLKHDDVASLSVRRVHRRLDFSRLGAPRGSRYEPLWWRHLLPTQSKHRSDALSPLSPRAQAASSHSDNLLVVEEYVPSEFLAGLIPEALTSDFFFWHVFSKVDATFPHLLWGYPKESASAEIVVDLLNSNIYKISASSGNTVINQLVNMQAICTRAQNPCNKLLRPLLKLDALSHILLWSPNTSIDEFNPQQFGIDFTIHCDRVSIELEVIRGSDGLQLHMIDDDLMLLPETLHSPVHVTMAPLLECAAVMFSPLRQQSCLVIPNYSLKKRYIKQSPFNCDFIQVCDSAWSEGTRFSKKYYVYNIHPSGFFLEFSSTASALYMSLIWLNFRRYSQAVAVFSQFCRNEFRWNCEERYILQQTHLFYADASANFNDKGESRKDEHPDVTAFRLFVVAESIRNDTAVDDDDGTSNLPYLSQPKEVLAELRAYLSKIPSVSIECALSQQNLQTLCKYSGFSQLDNISSNRPKVCQFQLHDAICSSNSSKQLAKILTQNDFSISLHSLHTKRGDQAIDASLELMKECWRKNSLLPGVFGCIWDMLTGSLSLSLTATSASQDGEHEGTRDEDAPSVKNVTVNIKLEDQQRIRLQMSANSTLRQVWSELLDANVFEPTNAYDFFDPVSKITYCRDSWSSTIQSIGFSASCITKQLFLVPSASSIPSDLIFSKLLLQCHVSNMLRQRPDAFTCLHDSDVWAASALIFLLKTIETKERPRIAALKEIVYPFDDDSRECLKVFRQQIKDVASGLEQRPFRACDITLPDCSVSGIRVRRPSFEWKCTDYCQKSIQVVTVPGLESDAGQLRVLAEMPLKHFCDQFVVRVDDDRVSSATDFPIDAISMLATSPASREFVSHLKDDFSQVISAQRSEMRFCNHADIKELSYVTSDPSEAITVKLNGALEELQQLMSGLSVLLDADLKCVMQGFNDAVALSNESDESHHDWILFSSLRSAQVRPWNTIEILIECMLSSKQDHDLKLRNPFLSASKCHQINQILIISLLKFVRTRQIMDCIQLAKIAHDFISGILSKIGSGNADSLNFANTSKTLHFHLLNLAEQLSRHRTSNEHAQCSVSTADIGKFSNQFFLMRTVEESGELTLHIDPRLLVFEFVSAFMLRTRQIELAFDFMQKIKDGVCSVQQMVMAAGKTSVITPLLALLLSGDRFVTCVCPAELLNQSRSEIRKKFSSILKKKVVTFTFSRESSLEILKSMSSKIAEAELENSVVCATPQSVKSALLKFAEIGLKLQSSTKDITDQASAKAVLKLARSELDEALKRSSYDDFVAERDLELHREIAMADTEIRKAMAEGWPDSQPQQYLKLYRNLESLTAKSKMPVDPLEKIKFEQESQKAVHDAKSALQRAETLVKDSDSIEMVDHLKKILSTWKKPSSIALFDEVDVIMHPLKSEMIFPIGHQEDLPMTDLARDRARFNLPIHVIVMMLQAASSPDVSLSTGKGDFATMRTLCQNISEGIRCKSIQRKVHPRPAFDEIICLDPVFYTEKLKPALGKLAVSWLMRNSFFKAAINFRAGLRVQLAENPSKTWLNGAEGAVEAFDAVAGKYLVKFDQSFCDQHNITPNPYPFATNEIIFPDSSSEIRELQSSVSTMIQLFVEGSCNHHDLHSLNLHPEAISFLNLARDVVGTFVPHIFSKFHRVSYGLLHPDDYLRWNETRPQIWTSGRNITAVPFDKINLPSKEAEFAHPDILIGFSVLSFLYNGMREVDIKELMKMILQDFKFETGSLRNRPASKLFDSWTMQGRSATAASNSLALQNIDVEDSLKMHIIHDLIAQVPAAVVYYLQQIVFPVSLRHKVSKVTTNGMELGSMIFGQVIGFSGTPSNMLPPVLRPCRPEQGTDGNCIRILNSPSVVSIPQSLNKLRVGSTTEDIIETVASCQTEDEKPFCALIDLGAQLTGLSNLEIAQLLMKGSGLLDQRPGMCVSQNSNQRILSRVASGGGYLSRTASAGTPLSPSALIGDETPLSRSASGGQKIGKSVYSAKFKHVPNCHCKKVCVFLDGGRQVFIDRNEPGIQLPIDRCHIPLQNRFTFFDQVHTTGIDTKQPLDGTAVCTVGAGVTLRDFFQGCWRMRKIGTGQRVHIMCVPEVQALIQRDLRLDSSDLLENRHILSWLCLNSVLLEEKQRNHMNFQVLTSVWRQHALSILVDGAHQSQRDSTQSSALSDRQGAAINIFRESIDLTVSNAIKINHSSFKDKAIQMVEAARSFIDVVKIIHPQIESEIQHSISQDGSLELEAEQSLDYQMVLEQDREKDEEKERAIEVNRYTEGILAPPQLPWSLDDLCSVSRLFSSQSPFSPLSGIQASGTSLDKLDLPTLLSSVNFCPKSVSSQSARLKNCSIIATFRIPGESIPTPAKRFESLDATVSKCISENPDATLEDIKAAFAHKYVVKDMLPATLQEIRQLLHQLQARTLAQQLRDVSKELEDACVSDAAAQQTGEESMPQSGARRTALEESKSIIESRIEALQKKIDAEQDATGSSHAGPPYEQPLVGLLISLNEAASLRRAKKMPLCTDNPLISALLSSLSMYTIDPKISRLLLTENAFDSAPSLSDQVDSLSISRTVQSPPLLERMISVTRFFNCDTFFDEFEFSCLLDSSVFGHVPPQLREAFFINTVKCRTRQYVSGSNIMLHKAPVKKLFEFQRIDQLRWHLEKKTIIRNSLHRLPMFQDLRGFARLGSVFEEISDNGFLDETRLHAEFLRIFSHRKPVFQSVDEVQRFVSTSRVLMGHPPQPFISKDEFSSLFTSESDELLEAHRQHEAETQPSATVQSSHERFNTLSSSSQQASPPPKSFLWSDQLNLPTWSDISRIGTMVSLKASPSKIVVDGDGNISAKTTHPEDSVAALHSNPELILIAPCGLVMSQQVGGNNSWYMEVTILAASQAFFGFRELTHPYRIFALSLSPKVDFLDQDILITLANVPAGAQSLRRGDVVGCLADFERGTLIFYCFQEDGQRFETRVDLTSASSAFVPVFGFDEGFCFNLNLGERSFREPQLFNELKCHSMHRWLRVTSEKQFSLNPSERAHYGNVVACELGVLVEKVSKGKWRVGADPEKIKVLLAKNPDLGFPTVLLRGVLLTQGKWYYEITIPKYQNGFCAQLGWADLHYFQEVTKQFEEFAGGHKGVGDDKGSWAFDGWRDGSDDDRDHANKKGCIWHQEECTGFGLPFPRTGECVLGCACDLRRTERTLSFFIDGKPVSDKSAFSNIVYAAGIFPGMTIQTSVLRKLGVSDPVFYVMNFGDSSAPDNGFKYNIEGHRPVQDWIDFHSPNASVSVESDDVFSMQPQPQASPPLGAGSADAAEFPSAGTGAKCVAIRVTSGSSVINEQAVVLGRNVLEFKGIILSSDIRERTPQPFPSCVADHVNLYDGKWFYQVRILSRPKHVPLSFGFAAPHWSGDWSHGLGCGHDESSWAALAFAHDGSGSLFLAAQHNGVSRKLNDITAQAEDVVQVTLNYSKQLKRLVIKVRVLNRQKNQSFLPSPWKTAFSSEDGHFVALPPQLTPCFSLGGRLLGDDEVRTGDPLIVGAKIEVDFNGEDWGGRKDDEHPACTGFQPVCMWATHRAIIHASPRAADDAVSDSIPSSPPPCDEITISVSYTSTLHTVIAPALCSVADVKAVLANHFGIPSSAASCLVYAGKVLDGAVSLRDVGYASAGIMTWIVLRKNS